MYMPRNTHRRLFGSLSALLFGLATQGWAAAANPPTTADLQQALQAAEAPACSLPALRSESVVVSLQRLYLRNGAAPLWQDAQRLGSLREQIQQLADDGLYPEDYPAALQAAPAQDVCDELLLSSEFLLALEHLSQGRLPRPAPEQLWVAPDTAMQPAPDPVALALTGVADPALAFANARPQLPLYQALRQVWQGLDKSPDTQPEIAAGAILKAGISDARVPLLAQRLAAQGYLSGPPPAAEVYDADLEAAVRRFQSEHGVQPDGVVGPLTLAALNLSPVQRLQQIRINLERLRWLNGIRAPYLLLVNIAAGDVRLYRDDMLLWRARAQTGRPARPTPMLVSRVDRLTLNPSWTIPPTIMAEDALPQIRRDPDYLSRNGLMVLDAQGRQLDPAGVDWRRPAGILLRQPPGPANPLGKLVFRFDNPLAVFLHDTPSQHLFARTARTLSSGCVRVEAAQALADLLLADLAPAERARVTQLLATGQTHEVALPGGPRLILGYWTAEAGDTGQVLLLPDPYRLDPALLAAYGAQPDVTRQVALQEAGTIGCGSAGG